MALAITELSVLAYANNFTLWHYKTTDTVVTGAGYFNGAADTMRVNDLIIANINTGVTPLTKFYIVTGISGGTVTIALYS